MALISKDERVLQEQLRYSKTHYSTWGRDIVRAIDVDDPIRIIQTLQSKKHLGADIDAQVDTKCYGGYAWTPWMHKFLGDTALHLAIKQKKILCISILLLLQANTMIPNAEGKTSEQLSQEILHRSLQDILNNSWLWIRMIFISYLIFPHIVTLERRLCDYCIQVDAYISKLQKAHFPKQLQKITLCSLLLRKTRHPMLLMNSCRQCSSNALPSSTPSYFIQDNIQDIVTMIHNQNRLAKRLYHDEQLKKSGLTILRQNSNTSITSNSSTTMLHKALTSLSAFKTLSKATSSVPEKQEKRFASDLPYRHITELSTHHNMKYMKIGDEGIKLLCQPLDNNRLIEKIVLSNAHITNDGASALCAILHRIHSLQYLDLSQNCLTDDIATVLASAAKISVSLKKLTIAANRLTVAGAEVLVRCLYDSPLMYLNLRNNKLSNEDKLYLQHIIAAKSLEWNEKRQQEMSERDEIDTVDSNTEPPQKKPVPLLMPLENPKGLNLIGENKKHYIFNIKFSCHMTSHDDVHRRLFL